jgi:hypothetical protein
VDARDVALTMMTAAEVRARGEFALAGQWVEYSDILLMLEDLTGRKARRRGESWRERGGRSVRFRLSMNSTPNSVPSKKRFVTRSHII